MTVVNANPPDVDLVEAADNTGTSGWASLNSRIAFWAKVLAVIMLLCMVGGLLGRAHRYLDAVSHFQVQYLIGGLTLAMIFGLGRRWRWAGVAMLGALWATARIAPWYVAAAAPGTTADIRIMLFNVLQTNANHAAVVAHVEAFDPDLIVLEEIDDIWLTALEPLVAQRPYKIFLPGGPLRGMVVLSRFPLEDIQEHDFGEPLTRSISGVVRVNDRPLHFVAAHPWPPASEAAYQSRNHQLEMIARHMKDLPRPCMLIGDLNVSMFSPYYRSLADTSGLVNTRQGFGVLASFPMDSYAVLRVPIDHCLVSSDVGVVDCRLGDPCGSDHAPLLVELDLSE